MVIAIFSFGMSLLLLVQWVYNKAVRSNPLATSGVMKGISQTSSVLGNWLHLVDGTLSALQRTKAFTNITAPVHVRSASETPHSASAKMKSFGSSSASNVSEDEEEDA